MEESILFTKTINTLKKYWWIIILFSVLGGVAGRSLYGEGPAPLYVSNVLVFIDNEKLVDPNGNYQSDDYSRFLNTAAVIAKTPVVLNTVKENLGLEESVNVLMDNIDVVNVNSSKILSIVVKSDTPEKSTKIANATALTFEQVVHDYLDVANIEILDFAEDEEASTIEQGRPNEMTIMGVLVGLVIGTILSFSISAFRKKKSRV